MTTKPALMVVAAVIESEGRILIGQRRAQDRHALKWEFPGGKVEPFESPRDALRRELQEELGVDAEIGPEIIRYTTFSMAIAILSGAWPAANCRSVSGSRRCCRPARRLRRDPA